MTDSNKKLLEQIKSVKNEKIIFWGASLFLEEFLKENNLDKFDIVGIIDKNSERWGQKVGKYEIFAPEKLKNINQTNIIHTVKNNSQNAFLDCKSYLEKNKLIHILLANIFNPKDFEKDLKLKYCPFCNEYFYFDSFGSKTLRTKVKCPKCFSLERHRYLYFIYKMFICNQEQPIKILHTAPEKCVHDLFVFNKNIDYTSIDLFPEKYKFAKNCKKMNVLDLKFNDNTFDFIITNHVAEHITDEETFLKEMLRVLKPNGKIILSVPYSRNLEKTFEDESINTDELRYEYYGQSDHVRLYGKDIFKRFEKYGKITKISRDAFPEYLVKEMSLKNTTDAIMFIEHDNKKINF